MASKLLPSKPKKVKAFALKSDDVTTEYYLERIMHSGTPMFIPIRDNLKIGRGICDAPHISRKHAMFQKTLIGCWFVKDLGSANGIYKNKEKLLPNCLHRISVGDYIGLGTPECEDNNQYLFLVGLNKNFGPKCEQDSPESESDIEIIYSNCLKRKPSTATKLNPSDQSVRETIKAEITVNSRLDAKENEDEVNDIEFKPRENNEMDKPRENNEMDKPRENNEMDKPRENNEMDKPRENNEMDKPRENNEMDKPRENNEMDKPRENNEMDKPRENNEMDKPRENNEMDKPRENNEMDKPRENNEMDKPRENNEMDKPRENNEMDKPRENNEMDKPRENNEMDKPRENNEMDKPRENDEMDTLQENNEMDKQRENNEMDQPRENYEMDQPRENNEMDKPGETNEMDKPRENDEMDKPRENDEMDKSGENNEMDKSRKNNEMDKPRENNEMDKPQENNELDKLSAAPNDESDQCMHELFGPFYDSISGENGDDLAALRPEPRNSLPISSTVLTNAGDKTNKPISFGGYSLGKELSVGLHRLDPISTKGADMTYSHIDDVICLDEDGSIFHRPIKIEPYDNLFPPEEPRPKPGNSPPLSATVVTKPTEENGNTSGAKIKSMTDPKENPADKIVCNVKDTKNGTKITANWRLNEIIKSKSHEKISAFKITKKTSSTSTVFGSRTSTKTLQWINQLYEHAPTIRKAEAQHKLAVPRPIRKVNKIPKSILKQSTHSSPTNSLLLSDTVVTKPTEENGKRSGVKRKSPTDTKKTHKSVYNVKKTKKGVKLTTNSRLDKIIKDAEEVESKLPRSINRFKKLTSKSLPVASTSTALGPNKSIQKTNAEVSSVWKPNTNQKINKLQDSLQSVQRSEAQPFLPKTNPHLAHLPDEFQRATSARVAERPRIKNHHPKSNFKQSKQMSPLAVTPIVSFTPRHTYTLDIYLDMVLKWNVKWLKEQERNAEPPPLMGKEHFQFHSVATHYTSIDDYVETYFPLIVLETWEMIFRDWKQKKCQTKNFEPQFFVAKRFNGEIGSTLGEIVLESVIEYKHLNYLSRYKEGMLIIFKMIVQRANNPEDLNWCLSFGYINRLKCSLFNEISNQNSQLLEMPASKTPAAQHIVLNVKIRPRNDFFKFERFLQIQPVAYLRPSLRQVQSLLNLRNSPLAKHILMPHPTAMTASVSPEDRFVPVGAYSSSQKHAILGAGYAGLLPESTPKIVLLQGLPGTGKTHTCVGLIQQLLYGRCDQNMERRLLVLAPSNAAIDEITRRLIELKPSIDANHPDSPISLVRVGQPKTMHCDVRAYSLDEIAHRKNNRETEDELNLQTNILQAKINALNTIIKSKLSLKLPVRQEQAQMALLHEKMTNNNAQKVKYNEKLANDKKQIITNTSIILTTLFSCRQSIMDQVFGPSAKPLKFAACIVDDAAQCSEPELLLPLQYQITKLILIGDPRQLPPTVLSRKASSLNFQKSLFERFYDYYLTRESPIVILKEQYRMHPEICSFPSKYFYHDALYTSPGINKQVANFPLQPYILLDIAEDGFQNENEAIIIQKLCQWLMMGVPKHCSIGIITPTEEQRDILTKHFSSSTDIRFEFSTVHGFQGRENDITILACINENDKIAIEFFKCPGRLNVAITRARQSLIICGNLQSLVHHEHWKRLIEDANARKLIFKIKLTDFLVT